MTFKKYDNVTYCILRKRKQNFSKSANKIAPTLFPSIIYIK